MMKLSYGDLKDELLIDIRTQYAFQAGHLKGALNLNPGNFKKFAPNYIRPSEEVILITEEECLSDLKFIANHVEDLGLDIIQGYLLIEEVPVEDLHALSTISAEDFLNLDSPYILLDVRHPDEITRPAPKKNLTNVPFENLPNKYDSLDKKQTIYTLCGSGNRSTAAASYLLSKGYKAIVIEGGMKAIQDLN